MQAEAKTKKTVIRWTDEEWDKLADAVCRTRKNSPDSIASIANRLQKQFPKDRQRPGILTTAALQPLVERVQSREREEQAKAEKVDQLQAKLSFFEDAPSTREELLTTLTDDEIRQHFLPRLYQMMTPDDVVKVFSSEQILCTMGTGDLAAVVAKRIIERIEEEPAQVLVQMQEAKAPAPVNRLKPQTNGKRKRIAVIGLSGDEWRHIRDKVGHLCDLEFIEVDRLRTENVPRNADKVILCAKCVSHKHRTMVRSVVEPRKVFDHYFGNKELVRKIEGLCRGEVMAK
jgi:hypothetical protein